MVKRNFIEREAERILKKAGIEKADFTNKKAWQSIVKDFGDIILTTDTWGFAANDEMYAARKTISSKFYMLQDMGLMSAKKLQENIINLNKILTIYTAKIMILAELAGLKGTAKYPDEIIIDAMEEIQIAAEAIKADYIQTPTEQGEKE